MILMNPECGTQFQTFLVDGFMKVRINFGFFFVSKLMISKIKMKDKPVA